MTAQDTLADRRAEAGLYRRTDALYLHAKGQTPAGLWITWPPIIRLATATRARALGEAILDVLHRPLPTVIHPQSSSAWKELERPLLEAAGVKTWRAFAESAGFCSLEDTGAYVRVRARENLFRKGERGFGRVIKTAQLQAPVDPAALGHAALSGLDVSLPASR